MEGLFSFQGPKIRKILVSVKLLSAILGPEMGVSILWTSGEKAFFPQEKPVSIKFLVFGGGEFGFFLGGGGECRFYFYGRADFSEKKIGNGKVQMSFCTNNSEHFDRSNRKGG